MNEIIYGLRMSIDQLKIYCSSTCVMWYILKVGMKNYISD